MARRLLLVATAVRFSDYNLIRHLGINPVQPGEQWLAEQKHNGIARRVVLVRLGVDASAEPTAVEAFIEATRREAELDHVGIARVLDIGASDGQVFYSRPWIDGLSLRKLRVKLASRNGSVPLEHALYIASQVAGAVSAAHNARDASGAPSPVIHGSLSSSRVVVSPRGDVVVTGPWAGDRPGRAEDVYGLAQVIYELVSGLPVGAGDRPRLSVLIPEIPAALDDLVERGLSRDPARRGGDIDSFAAELGRIASKLGRRSSRDRVATWLDKALTDRPDVVAKKVRSVIAIERTQLNAPRAARGSDSPPLGYARVPEVMRPRRSTPPRRRRRRARRALIVLAVSALGFAASTTITMALM